MAIGVLEVTDATFRAEVLEASCPVLVEFWAPGCRPCLALAGVLPGIAADWGDRLKVAAINAAENPDLARRCAVQGVPSLLFFQGGKPVETFQGLTPRELIARRTGGS